MVIVTRFPVGKGIARLAQERRNVLLHLTLVPLQEGETTPLLGSPPLPAPSHGGEEVEKIVASVRGVPAERLFFMFRPLVEGSTGWVERAMGLLPPGAAVGFREMSTRDIPGGERFTRIPEPEFRALPALAARHGARYHPFFGCLLHRALGTSFFRWQEAEREATEACAVCPNWPACTSPRGVDVGLVRGELERLDILARGMKVNGGGEVAVETDLPTVRAEEVYLSERFDRPVTFSSVARDGNKTQRFFEEDVLDRWERTGFYPVQEMREATERVMAKLAER